MKTRKIWSSLCIEVSFSDSNDTTRKQHKVRTIVFVFLRINCLNLETELPLGCSSSVRYSSLSSYAWFSWINVPSYCIIQNAMELQISMFVFMCCLVMLLRLCCNWKVKQFMCGLKIEILWKTTQQQKCLLA